MWETINIMTDFYWPLNQKNAHTRWFSKEAGPHTGHTGWFQSGYSREVGFSQKLLSLAVRTSMCCVFILEKKKKSVHEISPEKTEWHIAFSAWAKGNNNIQLMTLPGRFALIGCTAGVCSLFCPCSFHTAEVINIRGQNSSNTCTSIYCGTTLLLDRRICGPHQGRHETHRKQRYIR